MKTKLTPIAAAAAVVFAGAATPAFAQSAAAPQAAASSPTASDVQQVQIVGIGASRQAAISQKRNAESIVDVVTAEDVGKLPDKNVADAIQRLPGVNIASSAGGEGGFSEADRVSIRGTSPSLTQTLINGHAVSTGDWFVLNLFGTTVGRSASYSLLPAELVGSVVVSKSATADLPEGGVAGEVDIQTRHPLDSVFGKKNFSGQISLGAAHQSLAGKTDPQASALLVFHDTDRKLGLLVQGFDEKQHLRRDGQEVLGYFTVDASKFAPGSTTVINGVSQSSAKLNGLMSPTLIGEALFEQERHRQGGAFELQMKPNADFDFSLNGFFSRVKDVNFNTNFMASPKWQYDAGLAPTAVTVGGDGRTITSASFAQTNAANSLINDTGYRPGAAQQSWYLDADTKLRVTDRFTLTTKIGTTKGQGSSQEFASEVGNAGGPGGPTGLNYQLNGLGSAANVSFTGANPAIYGNDVWNWNFGAKVKVPDTENYAQADGDYAIDNGIFSNVKFGVRATDHKRSNGNWLSSGPNWANPNVGTTLPAYGGGTYPGNFGSAFGAPNLGAFRLTPGDIMKWATISTTANPDPNAVFNYDPVVRHEWGNDFSVREATQAAYAMADVNGDRWSGNFGLRAAHTNGTYSVLRNPTTLDSPSVIDKTSAFGPFVREDVRRGYTDWLPSANFRYDLTKDVVLRAAAARTMARPDYTALSSTTSVSDNLNTGSAGNPYLNPVRSSNFDVSAEWYFAPRSLLSAGLFLQDYSSFVEYNVAPEVHWSDRDQRYETYQITKPTNVRARNKGFELGYQQAIWGGFGANANYTFADGHTADGGEMSGNSKNTYNLEAYYENDRFSARLAYTHRSKFYGSYDRGTKEHMAGSGTLAASLHVQLTDVFSVNFDALNLNNPTLKYYGDDTEQPRAFYSNGRQYYLTLNAKF